VAMEDFDLDKEMRKLDETFESIDKTLASLQKKSDDGVRDILKYFDRIHDKLFTFNNIMIAGFFTISNIKKGVPIELILVPILNLCFLMFIEYRMMEKSRFEANIFEKNSEQIKQHGIDIKRNTNFSLLSIITTLIVTCFFLYNLFSNSLE